MGRRKGYHKVTIREVVCPICERVFVPAAEHIYRDKRKSHKLVCSYTCVLESERLKEAGAKAKKKEGEDF